MWILEYDEKRALEDQWEAGRAEGFGEGHEKGFDEGHEKGFGEGQLKLLSQLVETGEFSLEKAASMVGMTPEEFVEATESL